MRCTCCLKLRCLFLPSQPLLAYSDLVLLTPSLPLPPAHAHTTWSVPGTKASEDPRSRQRGLWPPVASVMSAFHCASSGDVMRWRHSWPATRFCHDRLHVFPPSLPLMTRSIRTAYTCSLITNQCLFTHSFSFIIANFIHHLPQFIHYYPQLFIHHRPAFIITHSVRSSLPLC